MRDLTLSSLSKWAFKRLIAYIGVATITMAAATGWALLPGSSLTSYLPLLPLEQQPNPIRGAPPARANFPSMTINRLPKIDGYDIKEEAEPRSDARNASALRYLRSAKSAVDDRRTGEAILALKNAEDDMIKNPTTGSVAGRPPASPQDEANLRAVMAMIRARVALHNGDVEGAHKSITEAIDELPGS